MRWLVALTLSAGMALAAAPENSLRPVLPDAHRGDVVPHAQPETAVLRDAPIGAAQDISVMAASLSLRPTLRPPEVVQKAMAKRRAKRRGAVCGDVDIQGEIVGRVPGRINGCGVSDAVRVQAVSGVALSQQAIMDCTTAKALKSWVTRSAKPALSSQGGGLSKLRVAAHYACRTRNNQAGARISEHGKGKAIDISGFFLKNGREITVLKGWNGQGTSQALRKMHKDACGPFGTVLGPKADRFHQDHFHFDTARHRGGSYCR